MGRERYALDHYIARCGKMGRLKTIGYIPVIAGDSLEYSIEGVLRMSPFRKEIVMDAQLDICGFYQPYRHVYANWEDMVRQGYDEAVTLASTPVGAGARNLSYLGINNAGATVPDHLPTIYNNIFNRYYRVPGFAPIPGTTMPATVGVAGDEDYETRMYGQRVSHLPHALNGATAIDGTYSAEAWRDLAATDADVASVTSFDVRTLKQVQGELKSEISRVWESDFYSDVMRETWGSNVTTDGDERPELLFRETKWLSGTDVNGTDAATLGSFVGKTAVRVDVKMPRRNFREHGVVVILACLRFPLVHNREAHFLAKTPNPTGRDIIADPDVWANMPTENFDTAKYLDAGSGVTVANLQSPFGNWMRTHPNMIDSNFDSIEGYPFSRADPSASADAFYYYQNGEYNECFVTSQLGHWQLYGDVAAQVIRNVPDINTSIYAGTR